MKIAQHLHNSEPRQWDVVDDMGFKVNDVCRSCNHGWMNRLEQSVRPFLAPMIQRRRAWDKTTFEKSPEMSKTGRCHLTMELAR